jgi:plastocyanin
MGSRHPAILCAVALAAASLAACGGGSSGYPTGSGGQNPPPGGQQPPSTTSTVSVQNNRFNPSAITVAAGTTVTWTWDSCDSDGYGGQTCVAHSVTFAGGSGSAVQSTGSYARTFNVSGTFNYQCAEHGATMSGQVVVQ